MTAPPDPSGRVGAAGPIDTVLFDLDGTITDSARGIVACFRHALRAVGGPEPDAEQVRGVVGPPILESLRRAGLDDVRLPLARAAYRERYEATGWSENAVYPGVADLLDRVAATGVTMGVATSKNQRMAHRILRHFDLDRHFAFIGGASDDDARSHKADVIAHTLRGLGRSPRSAADGGTPGVVLVGDRSHDVLGAAAFGVPAVLVGWGYGSPEEHRTARWLASTPADLGELLGRLSGGANGRPSGN